MAKSADAADLKSAGAYPPWGFKSPSGHHNRIHNLEDISDFIGPNRVTILPCPFRSIAAIVRNAVRGNQLGKTGTKDWELKRVILEGDCPRRLSA